MTKSLKDKLVLEPVAPDDITLRSVSKPVKISEIKSAKIQRIIQAMIDYSNSTQGDGTKRTTVGASAPQFGINKRITMVDVIATGIPGEQDLRVYINPEITFMSREFEDGREGCFSTSFVCGIVSRSKSVTIRAYNPKGELVEETYFGFPARVFQHEIDHLDGICFPDRITNDDNLHWVEADEFGDYRINWKTWTKKCPREKWEAIKYGKEYSKLSSSHKTV